MGKCIAVVAMIMGAIFFGSPAYAADLNAFTISEFKSDMTLSKTSDNRAQLKVVETITAQFSQQDVNKGLERAIPTRYDNHSLDLKIESVKDELGATRPFTERTEGELKILRIADMSKYVHGAQTYVVTYSMNDPVKYFANTDRQELYWDINGTGWKVPITHVSWQLNIDESLQVRACRGTSQEIRRAIRGRLVRRTHVLSLI